MRLGPGEYAVKRTTYSENRIVSLIPKTYSVLKCSCPATDLCAHLIGCQIFLGSFDHETKRTIKPTQRTLPYTSKFSTSKFVLFTTNLHFRHQRAPNFAKFSKLPKEWFWKKTIWNVGLWRDSVLFFLSSSAHFYLYMLFFRESSAIVVVVWCYFFLKWVRILGYY